MRWKTWFTQMIIAHGSGGGEGWELSALLSYNWQILGLPSKFSKVSCSVSPAYDLYDFIRRVGVSLGVCVTLWYCISRFSETIDIEPVIRDEPPLQYDIDLKIEEVSIRCLTLANILRGFSFIPNNEKVSNMPATSIFRDMFSFYHILSLTVLWLFVVFFI